MFRPLALRLSGAHLLGPHLADCIVFPSVTPGTEQNVLCLPPFPTASPVLPIASWVWPGALAIVEALKVKSNCFKWSAPSFLPQATRPPITHQDSEPFSVTVSQHLLRK